VPSKKVQSSEKARPALTLSDKEKQSTSPLEKVEISETLSDKTKDGETSANVGGCEVPLEPAAKRLKFSKWRLRAVLADAATERLPMVEVLTVEVEDPRQTSALVRKLSEVLPLPTLQHIKRVKSVKFSDKTRIFLLLCCSSSFPDASLLAPHLAGLGVDTSHLVLDDISTVKVAGVPPSTRRQYDLLRREEGYWPCNFHEDKYLESLVNETHELWSEDNRARQERHMETAMRLGGCGGSGCSGGVVVDPATDTVVAEAHSTTDMHPLHHTVMNLVDLVARSQGGGAFPHTATTSSFFYHPCLPPPQNGACPDNPPLPPSDNPPTHLKRYGSIGQLSVVPKTGPYLCTGYDVYLSREPCAMCAMALVHMRTRRVFYGMPSLDGALGTNDKIHTLEGLNHRFEVFCDILNCDTAASASHFCF